jgi:hypothetical protein
MVSAGDGFGAYLSVVVHGDVGAGVVDDDDEVGW